MSPLAYQITRPHPGQKAADSLAALRELVGGLVGFMQRVGRKSIRWALYTLVLLCMALPAILLIALAMRWVMRATRDIKRANQLLDQCIDAGQHALVTGGNVYRALGLDQLLPQQYARLKKNQDAWVASEKQLGSHTIALKRLEMQPLPRWAAYVFRPLANFYQAYRSYNQRFAAMLDLLDQASPEGQYFEKIGEGELWRRRNKAYEYLV